MKQTIKDMALVSVATVLLLAPATVPLPKGLQALKGVSLTLSLVVSLGSAVKMHEPVQKKAQKTQEQLDAELLAFEMVQRHEFQKAQIASTWATPIPQTAPVAPVAPQYQPTYQPQPSYTAPMAPQPTPALEGGYIGQPSLEPGPTTPQPAPIPAVETAMAVMTRSFKSFAIFGGQRTGKSYLASIASQRMAQGGTKVFHLNMASYGDEDSHYWRHVEQSVTCNLKRMEAYAVASKIQDALSLVETFESTKNALLIVDEWAAIGSTHHAYAKELEPLMVRLASTVADLASIGMKQRRAIWTIAPEMTANSLTNPAKAVKKLALVLVAVAPHTSVHWEGQQVTFDHSLFQQLRNNFPSVEMPVPTPALTGCDRIASVEGAWMPLGIENAVPVAVAEAASPVALIERMYQQPFTLPQMHQDLIDCANKNGGVLGSIDAHRIFPSYEAARIEAAYKELEALGIGSTTTMPYQGLVLILKSG